MIKAHSFNRDHTAIVLGFTETGLAAVRNLGREGIPVIGMECHRSAMSHSRYCEHRICPDPTSERPAFIAFLIAEARRLERPPVLFTAADAFVEALSLHQEDLSRHCLLILPECKLLGKCGQLEVALAAGMPVPTTICPRPGDDLPRLAAGLEYPVVVKGNYTHHWRTLFPGIKLLRCDTAEELLSVLERAERGGVEVLVQSLIPGPDTTLFEVSAYLNRDHEVLAAYTVRKLRTFPHRFGTGSLLECIERPALLRQTLEYLRRIDFVGMCNIEFKLDERDGLFKLIEINCRLWLQNDHAAACGINFPLVQYLDLTGQSPPAQLAFKSGVRWINPVQDFHSARQAFREGTLTAAAWLGSLRAVRSVAIFAADDPGPGLMFLADRLKHKARRMLRRAE